MVQRGFTPGGAPARPSKVRRPEANACVVYYRHLFLMSGSFLRLAQQSAVLAHRCRSMRFHEVSGGFDEVSGDQAFDTENCRVADHTGSGLDPTRDRARLGGVNRRSPRTGRVQLRVLITARGPNLHRQLATRHATDTVSRGHSPVRPCARNPPLPARSPVWPRSPHPRDRLREASSPPASSRSWRGCLEGPGCFAGPTHPGDRANVLARLKTLRRAAGLLPRSTATSATRLASPPHRTNSLCPRESGRTQTASCRRKTGSRQQIRRPKRPAIAPGRRGGTSGVPRTRARGSRARPPTARC